jgi:hypothetical protein
MKNKFYLLPIVALLLCLVGWTAHARAQRGYQERQTWEYRLFVPVAPGPSLQDQMNQLGAEGWELVAVRDDVISPYRVVCYFKRPK